MESFKSIILSISGCIVFEILKFTWIKLSTEKSSKVEPDNLRFKKIKIQFYLSLMFLLSAIVTVNVFDFNKIVTVFIVVFCFYLAFLLWCSFTSLVEMYNFFINKDR